MSLPALLIFAWAGSVVGENVGYLIGRSLGRAAVARYGAKIGLTAARYNAVEEVFAKYGPATVTFARFVNILRQLNGVRQPLPSSRNEVPTSPPRTFVPVTCEPSTTRSVCS